MAPDEPRRSGRATKGQNHKNSEEPELTTPAAPPPAPAKKVAAAKKGKGKASKKQQVEEEEEPEAIIRCICGYIEEDPDDKRAMICCDNCSAWQHNVCMGLPEDEDELPAEYFCEQCRPVDHQETVVALKRGQPIWEVRQAEHARQEEEERQRKKGGRKGRKSKGGKAADVADSEKQDSSQIAEQEPPQATPVTKTETGTKRKFEEAAPEDEVEQEEVNANKSRRVSSAKDAKVPPRRQSSGVAAKGNSKIATLQTELVEKIEDLLNRTRQRAATAIVKMLESLMQQSLNDRTFKLPKAQTKETLSLSMGLNIEFCLYINYWGHGTEPNPAYSEKLRVILHNVKNNPELRDRLFAQSLTPDELTKMSSDEMASRELQAEKAQMILETEKQHILLPESAPKYRKTHKGDELIEESHHDFVNNDSAPQLSTRIHEKGTKEESPDRMGSHSPTAYQPTTAKSAERPLTVDTTGRRKSMVERKSSSGFDMNNVWSSVDSPSTSRPIVTPNTPAIRGPGTKADAEIDQLLGGDDDDEPYSPAEYALEEGMIWRGSLMMPPVANFKGSARYAAGANLEKRYPWPSLIGKSLWIEGRIQMAIASEYICNLRYSKSTDVSVISLTPEDTPGDQENFNKLFDYFLEKSRWGVGKSPLPVTRDVYIIPLEAGTAAKPEFLSLLEDSKVEDNRTQRMLLIVYIIKLASTSSAQQAASSTTPATPANSAFPPPNATDLPPEKTGREAAEHVLGVQYINAPTVGMILAQAPNCGETQFTHVRECYIEDPRTMTDWALLVTALTARAEKKEEEQA